MKKIIFVLLLLSSILVSSETLKSMSADYDVSFGIVGKIGIAHCELLVDKGTYRITVDIKSSGLAKLLSRDREERYESTGLIKDSVLIPDLFIKNRKWADKEERKKYFINHKDKSVMIMKTSIKNSKSVVKKDILSYFSDNDILTLFFNINTIIKNRDSLKDGLKLTAIGANKKDGHLEIKAPNKREKVQIRKLLGVDNWLMFVTLNQKIFSSKNGQFVLDIDDRGVCDRFILKDVLMYGDLSGKIKNLNIKE